jgi:hypothetical protein
MSKRVLTRKIRRAAVPAADEVVEQKITVTRPAARKVLRTPVTLAEAAGSPTVLVREGSGKKTKRVKRAA